MLGKLFFFPMQKKRILRATHILPEGRLACGQYITWIYRMGSITHGKKSLWWILPEKGETLHQQWLERHRDTVTNMQTEPKSNIYIICVYHQIISTYGALSPSTRPHLKTGIAWVTGPTANSSAEKCTSSPQRGERRSMQTLLQASLSKMYLFVPDNSRDKTS